MSVNEKMTAIADALREKTGHGDPLTLEDMAREIGGLHTFTPSASGSAWNPEEVYRITRPKDWLPMPVPGDDEMYLLGHLMKDADNQFLIKLTFTGSCTVEFGNLVNGVFTPKETVAPVSDTMLYHALDYDDYGDETADGFRQYLVRISGAKIQRVYGGENRTDTPAMVVDFVCGIPLQIFSANGGQGNYLHNRTFVSTRYMRFVGNGKPGQPSFGFQRCFALKAVACQRANSSTLFTFTFQNCKNLMAVSDNLFSGNSATMMNTFQNANIQSVPKVTARLTSMTSAFSGSALEIYEGSLLDTSAVTTMNSLFNNCEGLQCVEDLDISALTNAATMFAACYSLQKLTFAGETTPGGITIDLTTAALKHTALVNMLGSLPVATAAATITITNNPGASELTEAEIAVATAKNWTVTI